MQGCSDNHTTFHEDIKPIIHRNCAICHNPNGAGPFDLITYQDVYKRGQMIKEVIMPYLNLKQAYVQKFPSFRVQLPDNIAAELTVQLGSNDT